MKLTFEEIEQKGLLLYRYIRGSQLYGTSVEGKSDIDEGGVYVCPNNQLLGLGDEYQDEISDTRHDKNWMELGKFLRLILVSNPTVLESLFVPDDKVIYEHPLMTEIKKHRDLFVTKECLKHFSGYMKSQIRKSSGQKKMIHWDETEMVRKTPLDFCYTFKKQGSEPINNFLTRNGLDQHNCALVNVPNMPNTYGVYYDFGQHLKLNNISEEWFCDENNRNDNFVRFVYDAFIDSWHNQEMTYLYNITQVYKQIKTPKGGHCGIISESGDSNEIRFSSVVKEDKPICFMTYNVNGYGSHCKKYHEYTEWKRNRNKSRYEDDIEGKKEDDRTRYYDSKNIYHCFRLVKMATEIANGEGFKVDRRNIDADFLIDVRTRKYTYEELMEKLTKLQDEMNDAISVSTIPETIDRNLINDLCLKIRNQFNNN